MLIRSLLVTLVISVATRTQANYITTVDADSFANGADLTNAFPGVVLETISESDPLDYPFRARVTNYYSVHAKTSDESVTGSNVFATDRDDRFYSATRTARRFRTTFLEETDFVAIDVVMRNLLQNRVPSVPGVAVYDSLGELVSVVSPVATRAGPVGVDGATTIYSFEFQTSARVIKTLEVGHPPTWSPPLFVHRTYYLDNLRYSTVPEVSTQSLIAFSGILFTCLTWRRRYVIDPPRAGR